MIDSLIYQVMRLRSASYGNRVVRQIRWRQAVLAAGLETPSAVVDIGVDKGTPELYRSCRSPQLVLVDPLLGSEADFGSSGLSNFQSIVKQRVAVGAKPGLAQFGMHVDQPSRSGFASREADYRNDAAVAQAIEVEVKTLAQILEPEGLGRNVLVKIDTEGHELEVLRGTGVAADRIGGLIAEVSIAQRFEGSYTFAEFIALADELGFELFDSIGGGVRSGRARYLDLLFTRKSRRS